MQLDKERTLRHVLIDRVWDEGEFLMTLGYTDVMKWTQQNVDELAEEHDVTSTNRLYRQALNLVYDTIKDVAWARYNEGLIRESHSTYRSGGGV